MPHRPSRHRFQTPHRGLPTVLSPIHSKIFVYYHCVKSGEAKYTRISGARGPRVTRQLWPYATFDSAVQMQRPHLVHLVLHISSKEEKRSRISRYLIHCVRHNWCAASNRVSFKHIFVPYRVPDYHELSPIPLVMRCPHFPSSSSSFSFCLYILSSHCFFINFLITLLSQFVILIYRNHFVRVNRNFR